MFAMNDRVQGMHGWQDISYFSGFPVTLIVNVVSLLSLYRQKHTYILQYA